MNKARPSAGGRYLRCPVCRGVVTASEVWGTQNPTARVWNHGGCRGGGMEVDLEVTVAARTVSEARRLLLAPTDARSCIVIAMQRHPHPMRTSEIAARAGFSSRGTYAALAKLQAEGRVAPAPDQCWRLLK